MLEQLGKCPYCNGRPETAPHVGKFCFPICWRCFAGICGAAAAQIVLTTSGIGSDEINRWFLLVNILLVLPCAWDGTRQTLTDYRSTNPKRIAVGSMAGWGLRLVLYILFGI